LAPVPLVRVSSFGDHQVKGGKGGPGAVVGKEQSVLVLTGSGNAQPAPPGSVPGADLNIGLDDNLKTRIRSLPRHVGCNRGPVVEVEFVREFSRSVD
ncbi:hypothetical protein TYRP_019855, partial [Tyrophagus putrescentiae]